MNFNNQPLNKGTIFVQVVVALAMVGVMLSATLGLQISVFKAVVKNSFVFERIIPLGNILNTAQKDRILHNEKTSYQKSLTDPEMGITLEKETIQNTSSLARFKRLFKETSRGMWNDWTGAQVENLISFVFIPEQKNKEEEKK